MATTTSRFLPIAGAGLLSAGIGGLLGHFIFHKPIATVIGAISFAGIGAFAASKLIKAPPTALQQQVATQQTTLDTTQANAEKQLIANQESDAAALADISTVMGQ